MQSTWVYSLCHDATATEKQQSKIQCHSCHIPIWLLAQHIVMIQSPERFGVWITFRRQLSKYKGRGEGICSTLPFASFFSLSLFFTIISNFVYAFYLIVLENELTFTVRGSFEETQTVSVGCDSHSPLPDPTFFHYARYKQPSLDVALRKKRKLPTFVRYPRTW